MSQLCIVAVHFCPPDLLRLRTWYPCGGEPGASLTPGPGREHVHCGVLCTGLIYLPSLQGRARGIPDAEGPRREHVHCGVLCSGLIYYYLPSLGGRNRGFANARPREGMARGTPRLSRVHRPGPLPFTARFQGEGIHLLPPLCLLSLSPFTAALPRGQTIGGARLIDRKGGRGDKPEAATGLPCQPC